MGAIFLLFTLLACRFHAFELPSSHTGNVILRRCASICAENTRVLCPKYSSIEPKILEYFTKNTGRYRNPHCLCVRKSSSLVCKRLELRSMGGIWVLLFIFLVFKLLNEVQEVFAAVHVEFLSQAVAGGLHAAHRGVEQRCHLLARQSHAQVCA